jgi:anthranilate/para-aminobenzoate synthase component II
MKAEIKKLKSAILIDHDDSFTFNLQHWLHQFCENVEIINHAQINDQNFCEFDLIVLSPGPKSPVDYPHVLNWLKHFSSKPVFGVCLGLQLLVVAAGGKVSTYKPPLHGKTSILVGHREFNGLEVARYHSLFCIDLPNFEIIAQSDNIPMWARHIEKKWLGSQFHPESFLTKETTVFQNFICDWVR